MQKIKLWRSLWLSNEIFGYSFDQLFFFFFFFNSHLNPTLVSEKKKWFFKYILHIFQVIHIKQLEKMLHNFKKKKQTQNFLLCLNDTNFRISKILKQDDKSLNLRLFLLG